MDLNYTKLFITILFLFNTLLFANIHLTQEEKEFIKNHPTITLGTDKGWEPYTIESTDGTISGYDVDVLNLINNLTGSNFVIKRGRWNDLTKEVKDNKIEGLSTGVINDEQSKYLVFSKPYLVLTKMIFTNTNNKASFNTVADLKGKIVAVNNHNPESIRIIKNIKGIKLLKLDNTKDVINAVTTGKADAMLGNAAMMYILTKQGNPFLKPSIILEEKPLSLVFSFRKDLELATSIINKALEKIGSRKLMELQRYWFEGSLNKINNIDLSTKEINYLKENKIIKMCNNPNIPPFEFAQDGDMGQMNGIAIDTIEILEKRLNIKFKNVATKNWTESQQFLKDKKCDILPFAIKNKERLKYTNFTKPYLSLPLAIFTQKNKNIVNGLDDLVGKTMSTKKGSSMIPILKSKYNDIKIEETFSVLESLQAVNNGKVYYTISNIPTVSYYMSKTILDNLQISGYINITAKASIAVRNDDKILLNILDKGLETITKEESAQIFKKWVGTTLEKAIVDYTIIWNILIIVTIIILFFLYRQYILRKSNKNLQLSVDIKTLELKTINENLKDEIKKEVEKNREKDKLIFKSEKLVSMGQMIGNIAHQWRQPLSVISTAASGMQLQKEHDILSDAEFYKMCDAINDNAQYLSKTIDDFTNFIKGDSKSSKFNLRNETDAFLKLVDSTIKNNHLDVVLDLTEDINIQGYPNELIQCFINIFNNAKDALVENNKEGNRYIFISQETIDNNVVIKFKDNAGGIPEDIINKIFEPYFTTKHQSQGTGLGLHMTYNLIVDGMNGTVEANNVEFEYESEKYTGAEFKITLPLS